MLRINTALLQLKHRLIKEIYFILYIYIIIKFAQYMSQSNIISKLKKNSFMIGILKHSEKKDRLD